MTGAAQSPSSGYALFRARLALVPGDGVEVSVLHPGFESHAGFSAKLGRPVFVWL